MGKAIRRWDSSCPLKGEVSLDGWSAGSVGISMESRCDTGRGAGILDISTEGVGEEMDEVGVAVWLRRGKIPSGRRGSRCS